jgi:thiol-disulfide isomerase/thioredoxin
MRRLPFILLTACLIGLGCNSTGKKPATQPPGPNGPVGTPFFPEDRPTASGGKEAAPVEKEGLLAGRLIDSSGQPQPKALINVTAADAGPNSKPIGIQSDEQGYFIIKGLKAGTTYFLSVRGDDRGRSLAGSTITQAPNTRLVIRMNEGAPPASASPPPKAPAAPGPDKKDGKPKLEAPTSSIPNPEPVSAPPRDPLTDQSYGPGKAPPPSQPLPPPPATGSPNIADSAQNWQPPTAAIPGFGPKTEPPPVAPSMSAVPSNSSPLTGTVAEPQPSTRINFTLFDAGGNAVDFRNLSNRRLIALDFWSTTCLPCLQKIPELIELQTKYAQYLDIVGVDCDNVRWPERKRAVEGIQSGYLHKAHNPINYGMYFEGDGQEGRVQAKFNIKAYPTIILLDYAGRELWRGSNVKQLEDQVKYYSGRR